MRLAILETGEPPETIRSNFPGYGEMMEAMLAPVAPAMTFERHRIFEGAPFPDLARADGVLTTGSPAGVYEGHAWIAPLETFLNQAAEARRPQIGICFGHQIMAQAFGGTVEKSDEGWGVGVHHYRIDAPQDWMAPRLGAIACALSHQDQITALPATGRRLGGSEFCEFGVVAYDHAPAASFQMHPEFNHAFAAALYRARSARIGEDLAAEAQASLKGRSDRAAMARWIAAFLRG
ncbi:MAG: type 1 glutamine amidotransferase [Pseudomonadota bacterium]